ncbi:MAG TPA: NFACT RNA binding domain-containing protein [Ktedonobacterales bacterium]|jgi:predicted ribosome quality control (RQC) complex YloA/Tae2 family protein
MYVDALTLYAIADELQTLINGARVEDVIQPTPHSIAIQCWTGSRSPWLSLSAHPQLARLHLTSEKPRKLVTDPPPFVMLLRKHLEGCRVEAVQQPRWERLVEIGFGRRSSAGQHEAPSSLVWLIIEVMGRLSNILLRDASGVILGSLKQIGPEVNRYRVIAPHEPYKYPPPQQRLLNGQRVPRLDPGSLTGAALRLGAEGGSKNPGDAAPRLWQVLTEQVMGFSPLLAREVVYRTLGASEAPAQADIPWERVAEQARDLAALMESRQWQPVVVERPDTHAPAAFAVYDLRQYSGWPRRSFARVNDLLDNWYRGAEWRDALQSAKADVARALQTHRDRCLRKAELLKHDLAETQAGERLRLEGEALLAFGQQLAPGQTSLVIENPFDPSDTPEMMTIALDPRASGVENANQRFARYHKLRRAGQQIPEQIVRNRVELAQLEQFGADLLLAETPAEVAQVRAEVAAAGYLRGKRERQTGNQKGGKGKGGKGAKGQKGSRQDSASAALRRQSGDGFLLLVGKNSRQNEEVTFREAGGNDLWLHARGVPGAHVIIKSGGREVPRRTLEEAARLAAYYSQARGNTTVPVDYTQQRYVRHMKGGGPGMVIYERERTLSVPPVEEKTPDAHG